MFNSQPWQSVILLLCWMNEISKREICFFFFQFKKRLDVSPPSLLHAIRPLWEKDFIHSKTAALCRLMWRWIQLEMVLLIHWVTLGGPRCAIGWFAQARLSMFGDCRRQTTTLASSGSSSSSSIEITKAPAAGKHRRRRRRRPSRYGVTKTFNGKLETAIIIIIRFLSSQDSQPSLMAITRQSFQGSSARHFSFFFQTPIKAVHIP